MDIEIDTVPGATSVPLEEGTKMGLVEKWKEGVENGYRAEELIGIKALDDGTFAKVRDECRLLLTGFTVGTGREATIDSETREEDGTDDVKTVADDKTDEVVLIGVGVGVGDGVKAGVIVAVEHDVTVDPTNCTLSVSIADPA